MNRHIIQPMNTPSELSSSPPPTAPRTRHRARRAVLLMAVVVQVAAPWDEAAARYALATGRDRWRAA